MHKNKTYSRKVRINKRKQMIEKYLSQTKSPSYYDWMIFSGLGYLDASKEWMQNIDKIKKHKKGKNNYELSALNGNNRY